MSQLVSSFSLEKALLTWANLCHYFSRKKRFLHEPVSAVISFTCTLFTESLGANATHFKDRATDVRKSAQRRNWKFICCIVCFILVVLGIITLVVLCKYIAYASISLDICGWFHFARIIYHNETSDHYPTLMPLTSCTVLPSTLTKREVAQ